MSTSARPLNVALAGFGTVGTAVARILLERDPGDLRLRAIATRRAASVRPAAPWIPPDVAWTDRVEDLLTGDADVVVELIGGLEPARSLIAGALASGRSVVTANKQVLAEHGPELVALARGRGRSLRFEAAVAGVTPVLRGVQAGLAADALTRIAGIVNGTANYVLTRMERDGVPLEAAVADAQALGYAEADPSADLDGLDARAKLVILTAVGLGAYVAPSRVHAESIRGLEPADLSHAASIGRVVRQVTWAERAGAPGGGVRARVSPALVSRDSWLARAEGPRNVVVVRGARSGDTVFVGEGAGGDATAVAVVSDLLATAHAPGAPRPWPAGDRPAPRAAANGEPVAADLVAPHYVRVSAPGDHRGHPDPTHAFARHRFPVRTVLDDGTQSGGRTWAGVLETCSQAALTSALAEFTSNGGAGCAVVRLPLVDVG